jgi:hypothetical protein
MGWFTAGSFGADKIITEMKLDFMVNRLHESSSRLTISEHHIKAFSHFLRPEELALFFASRKQPKIIVNGSIKSS